MRLLALDTATSAVTVAVHDGASVLAEHDAVGPLQHGELLAPAIADALATAGLTPTDLTGIAVGIGPGPFTGLRVGIVTARVMASTLGIPVVGVCTLDVLAAAVDAEGPFLATGDARRKEVYCARYADPYRRLTDPAVARPGDVATDEPVAGRGAVLYPEAFPHAVAPEYPRAADLARLVASGHALRREPEPLYLRRPDTAAPSPRKRVL